MDLFNTFQRNVLSTFSEFLEYILLITGKFLKFISTVFSHEMYTKCYAQDPFSGFYHSTTGYFCFYRDFRSQHIEKFHFI